ncbi:MAG: hypothetical protein EBR23_02345, partial [Planctomycetia bacterium]|nr:hypothetical protein [Planctomycetia bacterium]
MVVLGILGGAIVTERGRADDAPPGPRAAAWQRVQKAFDEGKPKTALEALAGVEQAAVADKAWAEVARAIASRILAETGDRPPDDPERLILLAGAIDKAPAETRGVLEAIRANWTWGFFQQNRWRFQQRTQGGADAADLTRIAEWDLPTIVAEIRTRFAAAVGAEGSPERQALQALPVADWSALLRPGTLPDAYRPTVWDVVARDALEFAASGERGLVNPEDAFELDADSPALGTMEEFLAWKPESDPAVTDASSPLLEAARLYRALIAFHHGDKDQTALLAADLDRILWAAGSAVGPELADRKQDALEAFIERAADHETASLARFHLATLLQEQGDFVAARTLAAVGAESHPKSAGGAQCANLVTAIEQKELALVTERAWAEPWPVVRVSYRNLGKVHLRVCKADWQARLRAGRPHPAWLDDADRAAILALPAVREHAADLPATPDFRQRQEDIAVAEAIDAKSLEPGCYWVIASQRADFGEQDNVVAATMVRVTRLAIVSEQARPVFEGQAGAARARRPQGPGGLSGYVVDIATGEPVAGAAVKAFAREQGPNQQGFAEVAAAATDKEGRYDLQGPQGREIIVVATAALGGKTFEAASDSTHVWPNVMPAKSATIVLVIDRGIHRPGQIVYYKGIACESEFTTGTYRAVADRDIEVFLRDANGREVAKARQRTSANGSFHGNFPIATGALPGQWSLVASGGDVQGAVGVRVEEYKRPKFQVKLAAPAAQAVLGGEVSVAGTATTYTGLAVADAKVAWRVERLVRWPMWCRWFFPGLPFGGEAQRIARGTARTDADGKFTVAFSAKPDRSVPRESLPVFTYRLVADVTDPGGETRSDERSVSAGYTDVEATLAAAEWQAVVKGEPAAVAITLATTTLDGEPRAAAGTLTVAKLVQPQAVARGDILG